MYMESVGLLYKHYGIHRINVYVLVCAGLMYMAKNQYLVDAGLLYMIVPDYCTNIIVCTGIMSTF